MKILTWIAGGLMLFATHIASAESNVDGGPKRAGSIWVNLGAFSTHLNEGKNYNSDNLGLGLEYSLTPDVTVLGGRFHNSVRHNSNYAAIGWQPLHWGNWMLGAAVGVMDGYPAEENGGTFFAALPTASFEGERFGINLAIIPDLPKVDGALVIQLKMRLR